MAIYGEAATTEYRRRAAPLFLRALLAVLAGAIVALFFVNAPRSQPGESSRAGVIAASARQDVVPTAAPDPAPGTGPTSRRVLSLYEGPSDDYQIIGTIARNATLDVVGRSQDLAWVAVSVAPGSTLYAWVRVRDVDNLSSLGGLPVKPATIISSP